MCNFWTIQSTEVINIVNNQGCYYPDFAYQKAGARSTYQIILDSFNNLNKCTYSGLVFGFAKKGENNYFDNINEIYTYFLQNPDVTAAFDFWNEQYAILQLQFQEEFNMIPVDFNDFIQIIPPIWDRKAYELICSSIKKGVNAKGYTLPSFTQIHAPYIKKENIINIYGSFNKIKSDRNNELVVFPLKC